MSVCWWHRGSSVTFHSVTGVSQSGFCMIRIKLRLSSWFAAVLARDTCLPWK